MRPYRFAPLATSRPLAIGAGVAQGVNSAVNNFARMRMQQAQMQAHQTQAKAQMVWRQAQAESLRQKSMSADVDKVQLYQSMRKATDPNGEPVFDSGMLKKFESKHLEAAVENMNPQERAAATQRFSAMADKGQMAPEFNQFTGMNPTEAQMYRSGQTNQTKENVAGTQAGARIDAANIYGKTRSYVADTGADARVQAAGISAQSKGSAANPDAIAERSLYQRINQLTGQYNNAAKPSPITGMSMDPDSVKRVQSGIQEQINQAHQELSQLHSKGPSAQSGQAPAASQPGGGQSQPVYPTPNGAAPPTNTPKVVPADQRFNAAPGDYVPHPQGGYLRVNGKGPNGAPTYDPQTYPTATGAAQAASTPPPAASLPQDQPSAPSSTGFPPVQIQSGGQ